MSWISDFAGKAETFLNKIDQNAAVALNSVESSSRSPRSKSTTAAPPSYSTQNLVLTTNSYSSLKEEHNADAANPPAIPAKPSTSNTKYQLNPKGKATRKAQRPNTSEPAQNSGNSSALTLNGSSEKLARAKATDDELLHFLNAEPKEIDVNSLLKAELETQKREMSILVRNNKKLQMDFDALKNHLDTHASASVQENGNPNPASLIPQSESKVSNLEQQIVQKNMEIDRLTERLDQALSKLQSTEELESGQSRMQLLEEQAHELFAKCQDLTTALGSSSEQLLLYEKQNTLLKNSLGSLEKEFCIYKDKAKMILKSKEDLIASIKSESGKCNEDGTDWNPSTENQFLFEIDSLRNERELLHAEIAQSRSYIDSMREENNRLESELQTLRSSNTNSLKLLSKEKQKSDSIQRENLQFSQEISNLQLLLERERIEGRKAAEKFYDQNSNSVGGMTKSSSLTDFGSNRANDVDETDNLRTRITALSQSLLEKQGLINSLSSDKQLLQIRCERLHSQLEELNCCSDGLGSGGNITQSVLSSQPLYLTESPWDSRVASRVKRAYSSVDSFCCQIGVVLRQRPNLRLGFCVYILCLHLWVFLILFTWVHHSPVPETK